MFNSFILVANILQIKIIGIITKSLNFRLYVGATFKKPKNGMFSFFPCLPYQLNSNRGFARPVIQIPSVISDRKNQGYKLTRNCDISELWKQVKNQVQQGDLQLGIHANLPTQKVF